MDDEPKEPNVLRYASPGKRRRARPSIARGILCGVFGSIAGSFFGTFVLLLMTHGSSFANRADRDEAIYAALGVVIACTVIMAYFGYTGK